MTIPIKENPMEKLLYQIALTLIDGVGPVLARNLLSYCGSPEEVFQKKAGQLAKIPGIGASVIAAIRSQTALQKAEAELARIEKNKVRALFITDSDYPLRLRQLPDSPLMIYVRGDVDLNAPRSIGIVGTRTPTPRGLAFCEELVTALSPFSPLIISGLAYGIDICAHRVAVQEGMPTVAVLAHGLGTVYPAAHRSLAHRIEENGLLLTEYGFDTTPEREHFPMRNRIVAGLCDALVVVETGLQGGSMITADLANGYGRDVFAFPGRASDSFSSGCNNLIKTNRAALFESAADLVEAMDWEASNRLLVRQGELFADLDPAAKKVLDLLKTVDEMGIDQLALLAAQTPGELATLLLDLEFQGWIKSFPGKRFGICRK